MARIRSGEYSIKIADKIENRLKITWFKVKLNN